MTKILLAEDEANLGMVLKEYLQAKAFYVDLFPDGEQAGIAFGTTQYDLCILDVMMPVKDGFTLAKEIRQVSMDIPIIFLTARSMKDDVIEGFKIGADDYITKPFSMEELLFRIEAVLRRTKTDQNPIVNTNFQIGKYLFDVHKQILHLGKETRKLTTKESELLRLLCENNNNILDRNYALKEIWQEDSYFNARSMDVYITKLRKYLNGDPNVEIINVHGKGFKLIF